MTVEVKQWMIKKLLALRQKCVVTSTTLQSLLAKERKVKVSAAHVRRVLKDEGYRWLRRTLKRVYDKDDKEARKAFARAVLRLPIAELNEKMSLSMDGTVIIMPPKDYIDRLNHCRHGEEFMYRKQSERSHEDIQGYDHYYTQAPLERVVPLWGGVSPGGFGVVAFHKKRKMDDKEWSGYVRAGKLRKAIQKTKPVKRNGPWTVLCDGEGFMKGALSKEAHKKAKVTLWKVPPRSPDLNPIERYWSWLKKKLRAMDLEDCTKQKPVLSKRAYIARVRREVESKQSQKVARNYALGLRNVCKKVLSKEVNGGATRG